MTKLSIFKSAHERLQYLEKWKELGERPSRLDCSPEDVHMLDYKFDDIKELSTLCLEARKEMNMNLPPHELVRDDELITMKSKIPCAGIGLFFSTLKQGFIRRGDIVCYYTGHYHNYHSMKQLKDKSYLLLVSGDLFVDPGPLPNIKARYINDPLNEDLVNCYFTPEAESYRCAVVAKRDIQCGEELYVSYGEMYWSNQPCKGTIYFG